MKTAVFYYFTGSGNTFMAMDVVRKVFEEHSIHVETHKIEEIKQVNEINHDMLGLFFPVAIQSTFPLVWDFIYDLPPVDNQKVFMLDTMEQFSGGIVGPVKKILKEKGYLCVGAIELKMGSSMQVKGLDIQSIKDKNTLALTKAEKYAHDLISGKSKWSRLPVFSDLMRDISKGRKIWTQTSNNLSINHSECIKCGLCIKKCPVVALSLSQNHVNIDHTVCNTCMRCAHICPKDAFLYKNQKVIHFNNKNNI